MAIHHNYSKSKPPADPPPVSTPEEFDAAHEDVVSQSSGNVRMCRECQKPFTPTGRNQKYCPEHQKHPSRAGKKSAPVAKKSIDIGGNLSSDEYAFALRCIELCKAFTSDVSLVWNGVRLTITKE